MKDFPIVYWYLSEQYANSLNSILKQMFVNMKGKLTENS